MNHPLHNVYSFQSAPRQRDERSWPKLPASVLLVHSLVRIGAFDGELVFLPDLRNHMHRRPSLTEQQVVEITPWKQVVFIHDGIRHWILLET